MEEKIKQNIINTCLKTASSLYIIYNKTKSNKHYVLCGNDFNEFFGGITISVTKQLCIFRKYLLQQDILVY